MKLVEVTDSRKKVYFLPLGDLHIGSPDLDEEKLKGYVQWAKSEKAYIFLLGDLFDVSTLESPTHPFTATMTLNEAMKYLADLLRPCKSLILGAIEGNHELRLWKYAGFSVIQGFCDILGINYCGYSAVIRFRLGQLRRKTGLVSPRVEYIFFTHHSTGGGRTLGGKINRAEHLRFIFEGADAYIIGHNHAKALGEEDVAYLCKSGNGKATIKFKRIYYIDAGSFIKYDNSYAEMSMLRPSDTGAPRIRMDGCRKDLHVSY